MKQYFTQSIERPMVIAGPCSAETREQVLETAAGIQSSEVACYRAGLWKPRTRPGEFEGVGDLGLEWLKEVKETYGLPVCTEVAKPSHIESCMAAGVDALWIGARSTTSPFVVQEIAEALRGSEIPVFVKNPLNPDVKLWLGAVDRLVRSGVKYVGAIHRGFSVYEQIDYRNRPRWQIVVDFKRQNPDMPMLCDPSHIGGKREYIFQISQKALDMSFDGLMIETHCTPEKAWTDAPQQVTPDSLSGILANLTVRSELPPLGTSDELTRYRKAINDLDDELIKVLERRMQVSGKIGAYKRENNMTILQSTRWKQLLADHKSQARRKDMSESFISELFKLIHQESIDIQERILTSEAKSQD